MSLVAQMVKNPPAMWETWVQSLGWEYPLEKEMATHSSILARESRGQRSLVGYSPWSSLQPQATVARVGHNLATKPPHRCAWAPCPVTPVMRSRGLRKQWGLLASRFWTQFTLPFYLCLESSILCWAALGWTGKKFSFQFLLTNTPQLKRYFRE